MKPLWLRWVSPRHRVRIGPRGMRVGVGIAPLRGWQDIQEVVVHPSPSWVRVAVYAGSGCDGAWIRPASLPALRAGVWRYGKLRLVERPYGLDDAYQRWRGAAVLMPSAAMAIGAAGMWASASPFLVWVISGTVAAVLLGVGAAVEARARGYHRLSAAAMVGAVALALTAFDGLNAWR